MGQPCLLFTGFEGLGSGGCLQWTSSTAQWLLTHLPFSLWCGQPIHRPQVECQSSLWLWPLSLVQVMGVCYAEAEHISVFLAATPLPC